MRHAMATLPRALLMLGVAGALSGCVSAADQRNLDMQACSGYGYHPGTDEYAHCMMQTAQHREAMDAQRSMQKSIAWQQQLDRAGHPTSSSWPRWPWSPGFGVWVAPGSLQ